MQVYKGEQFFVNETQSLRIAAWGRKTLYADNYRVHLPLSGQKSKTNLRSFIINEVVWYHWWFSHGNEAFIKKKKTFYTLLYFRYIALCSIHWVPFRHVFFFGGMQPIRGWKYSPIVEVEKKQDVNLNQYKVNNRHRSSSKMQS